MNHTRRSIVLGLFILTAFVCSGSEAFAVDAVVIRAPNNGATIPPGQAIQCSGNKDMTGSVTVTVKLTRGGTVTSYNLTTMNMGPYFNSGTAANAFKSGDKVQFIATDSVNTLQDTVTITIQ